METCPYLYYAGDNRCRLNLPGQSDLVEGEQLQSVCRVPEAYPKCARYLAWLKESRNMAGCYLTSACVKARGLPDDCRELEVLRDFRDGWLKKQDGGEAAIAEYYALAPAIVSEIEASGQTAQVYEEIYADMVLPCVEDIEQGRMERAYTRYKAAASALGKRFLILKSD